ncbi:MAG: hypothetical protein HDR02_03810 [Lachnospiraceae bacterium]|nr:hypothetical protein [Lachnospiraceae bacterium]
MSCKKNAISYGIWALYLMVVGIVLSFMGMVVGGQNTGVPYMALILLALAFGILFLVYFLAKKIVDSVQVKKMASGRAALVEGILVVLFLLAGIAMRVLMIGDAGEEAAYYEVAKVTESGMQVQLVQGSIYYYLCLLNGLFRLVGNKWMAGIVLQIVLQMIGIGIAYFAVRRLSGKGPALVSLMFLTMAPGSVRDGITYSPKMLYFCMYVLILLIIAQYLWRSTRPGGRVLTWILAVICGALVAFAGYTDIVGFTLAIPLCGLPTLKREQRGMALWVAQFLLSILTMAGVFCLLVQMDSAMSGSSFERVLGAWGATYGLKGADYDFFFREGGYETILLMVLIALGLFTFMRRKNEEMFSPWIMTVLSITLMRILGVVTPNMNGSYQMYFAMTGLAGVALSELFVRDGGVSAETADVPEAMVDDLDEEHTGPVPVRSEQPVIGTWPPLEPVAAADAVVMEELEQPRKSEEHVRRKFLRKQKQQEQTDVPVWESLTQEPATEHSEPENPAVEVKKDMTEKKQEEITMQQEETPKQVQFIENPLPLPKKHVKKVMDYPIQPQPSQMHYDIEVDPKDNFDF